MSIVNFVQVATVISESTTLDAETKLEENAIFDDVYSAVVVAAVKLIVTTVATVVSRASSLEYIKLIKCR